MEYFPMHFQNELVVEMIDQKRLLELYELDDGSSAFAMSLVDDFISHQEDFFFNLELGLQNHNLSTVSHVAHKLKSSLSNIAAGRAASVCANIEKKAGAGAPVDTVVELVESLKHEVRLFLNAIR